MFYTQRCAHNILYYENWLREKTKEKTKWLRRGIAHSWRLVWVNVILSHHASVQFAHLLNFTFSTWSRRLVFYLYVLSWMRYSLIFQFITPRWNFKWKDICIYFWLPASRITQLKNTHDNWISEYFQKNIQVFIMHYGWVRVKKKWWKLKKKQKKEQKRTGSWREKPKAFLRSFELKLPNSWLNKIHTWNWTVLIAELGYKYDFQWVSNLKPFHSIFKKKIFLNNIVAVTDDLVYCYLIFYKEKQAQNQHEKKIYGVSLNYGNQQHEKNMGENLHWQVFLSKYLPKIFSVRNLLCNLQWLLQMLQQSTPCCENTFIDQW